MKLWPARSKHVDPVVDLDNLIAEKIAFKFKGKIHYLKPISLEEFLRFTNKNSEFLTSLKDDKEISAKELAMGYLGVINTVCESIGLDDIEEMEQAQIAALYQLIVDTVTGSVETGEGKKKRLRLPIYHSKQATSLQNAAGSLDGQSQTR